MTGLKITIQIQLQMEYRFINRCTIRVCMFESHDIYCIDSIQLSLSLNGTYFNDPIMKSER